MLALLAPLLVFQTAMPAVASRAADVGATGGPRMIAIDERLAADEHLRVGDRLVVRATPTGVGDTVVVGAIVRRAADPSEVARGEYRVLLHLDQLQALIGYGDRVDRFAVATRDSAATDGAMALINDAAFGFEAHRSRDIAVETSQTFLVVSRFHHAIGVITIVASAVFLLCIMLLKVDERRRDVAALRLMGISSATVLQSIVLEATARRGGGERPRRGDRMGGISARERALPRRVPNAAGVRDPHARRGGVLGGALACSGRAGRILRGAAAHPRASPRPVRAVTACY